MLKKKSKYATIDNVIQKDEVMEQNMGTGREIRTDVWFDRAVHTILLILTVLCIGIAIIGGYDQIREGWYTSIVLAGLVAVVAVLFFAVSKTKQHFGFWLVVIFAAALGARLVMLQLWPIEPISDFKDTYRVAEGLASVPPSAMPALMQQEFGYYYSTWSVHIVFILLKAAIIKIFGAGYFPIQVVFNLFGAWSCVMAALIAKSLYGRRAGILAGMVMAFLPLNLLFCGILSNQHVATSLFLTGIYFLIANPCRKLHHGKLLNVGLAAIFLCLSQLIRPEMLVFLLAVACYWIYTELIHKQSWSAVKEEIKQFVLKSIVFFGVYFVILYSVNGILLHSGLIGSPITDSNIPYKIATGLNQESKGLWNEQDAANMENDAALKAAIAERTQDIPQVIRLMGEKLAYQFGTYDYSWCVIGETGEFVSHWYRPLTTDIMLVFLLLILLEIASAAFTKDRRTLLLYITLIGYFLVFAVIEVQNRYNYGFIPIFLILASGGLIRTVDTLRTVVRIRRRSK